MFEDAIRAIVREELQPLREVLESLKRPPPVTPMMTPLEAAELARRTPETVREWVRTGKLKRYGTNGRLLVRREELLGLLESEPRRVTDEELTDMASRILGRR